MNVNKIWIIQCDDVNHSSVSQHMFIMANFPGKAYINHLQIEKCIKNETIVFLGTFAIFAWSATSPPYVITFYL